MRQGRNSLKIGKMYLGTVRDEGEVAWNSENGEELAEVVREGKRQLGIVRKGKNWLKW